MKQLSEKIKEEREQKGLTQYELAQESELSRSTIQRMEEIDNHNWQLNSVLKIFKFFKWNVQALIEQEGIIYFNEELEKMADKDVSEVFMFGYNEGYHQGSEDVFDRYYDYKKKEEFRLEEKNSA